MGNASAYIKTARSIGLNILGKISDQNRINGLADYDVYLYHFNIIGHIAKRVTRLLFRELPMRDDSVTFSSFENNTVG